MKRNRISLIFALSILTSISFDVRFQAQGGSPYPVTTGKAYKFEKITDGVYYATATGSIVTGSNNVAIVGDRDVLVVDTGTSPAAARAFQEDLKAITSKPIPMSSIPTFTTTTRMATRYMQGRPTSSRTITSKPRFKA